MFLYKNLFFFNIFYSFNPNQAYWNQRRLFSGNLPGMFTFWSGLFYKRKRSIGWASFLFGNFVVYLKQEVKRLKTKCFIAVNAVCSYASFCLPHFSSLVFHFSSSNTRWTGKALFGVPPRPAHQTPLSRPVYYPHPSPLPPCHFPNPARYSAMLRSNWRIKDNRGDYREWFSDRA